MSRPKKTAITANPPTTPPATGPARLVLLLAGLLVAAPELVEVAPEELVPDWLVAEVWDAMVKGGAVVVTALTYTGDRELDCPL